MTENKVICPEGLKQKRSHLYSIYINTVHRLNRDARLLNDEVKDDQDRSSLFWDGLEKINETIDYLRQLTHEYETIRGEIINAGPPERPSPDDPPGGTPMQAGLGGGLLSEAA